MRYFQTWPYVARIKPRWIAKTVQFLCGIFGHEISKTEWSYGGGNTVDVWCRWCNKLMSIHKTEACARYEQFRKNMDIIERIVR
jgi:hypothetical protein